MRRPLESKLRGYDDKQLQEEREENKRMSKMTDIEIDRQRKIFMSNLTGFQSFMNLFMGKYNGFSIDYTKFPEDLKQYNYNNDTNTIWQGKPGSAEYKKVVESLKKKYWSR